MHVCAHAHRPFSLWFLFTGPGFPIVASVDWRNDKGGALDIKML